MLEIALKSELESKLEIPTNSPYASWGTLKGLQLILYKMLLKKYMCISKIFNTLKFKGFQNSKTLQ